MTLRVAVTGATGRMGQSIAKAVAQSEHLTLSHLGTYSGSSAEGRSVAELFGMAVENVEIATDPASLAEADVVIDFTLPEVTLVNAAACAARGTPMVIGTTGFSSDQLERLDAITQEIPVCRAANFSTGVTLAYRLIELAAEVMGVDADVEIAETHHRNKIDAPSGTALAMGEVIAGVRGVPLDTIADYDRSSRREPRRAGSRLQRQPTRRCSRRSYGELRLGQRAFRDYPQGEQSRCIRIGCTKGGSMARDKTIGLLRYE